MPLTFQVAIFMPHIHLGRQQVIGRSSWGRAAQQDFHVGRRQSPRKVISLCLITLVLTQQVELGAGFDPSATTVRRSVWARLTIAPTIARLSGS